MKTISLIALGSLLLVFAPSLRAEDITIDWERAKELHRRASSGEALSAEDQKYYEEARRQFAKRGQDDNAEMQRAREIHERMERGEAVSDEDKKFFEGVRRRMEAGRGERGPDGFDMQRLRDIKRRTDAGESVSEADKKYLQDAMDKMRGSGERKREGGKEGPKVVSEAAKNLVPLTELTGKYRGWDGGLYGGGSNEVPAAQQAAATKALSQIQPLDADGKPSPDGKIVLMSIGMSNTTMEFGQFVRIANADERKASNVVIVDAAQGGKAAAQWAGADLPPWTEAANRLERAQVSAKQVQVLWVKQANISPGGENEAEVTRLQNDVQTIVTLARQKYPNVRIAFLSSRIYGGYASTRLNPEPYAYEGAFAMRGLIQKQMKGDDSLSADKAPVLLWGPYLWGAGETPRKADGIVWKPEDFGGDGTHPSDSGREKVAKLLLTFFTTDANAKPWFVKK